MEKQKKGIRKTLIIQLVLLGLIIAATSWFVFYKYGSMNSRNNQNPAVFTEVQKWLPQATWSTPSQSSSNDVMLNGTLQAFPATIQSFQSSSQYLTSLGYTVDNSLAADGPGSSQWGYTKMNNGQTTTVIFNFKVSPSSTNPNEPVQFNCPCSSTVSVEIKSSSSNSGSSSTQGLANPASVNCAKAGGTTLIKNGPNGQYGLCDFGDNMQCEEWALFRGQCPVGGVKTTGFDTIEQKYCAWVGGQTYAVPNAKCTLPSGKICPDEAVYNGTCTN